MNTKSFNTAITTFVFCFSISTLMGQEKQPNDYFNNKKCQSIVDQIIKVHGGQAKISEADCAKYQMYVKLNLFDFSTSYPQTLHRKGPRFLIENEIQGEKITTGYNTHTLWQSKNKQLYTIPKQKKNEILKTFKNLLPHQHILHLKDKNYNLSYQGIQKVKSVKAHSFLHTLDGEKYYLFFSIDKFYPFYTKVISDHLAFEIYRKNFISKNGIPHPINTKIFLDQQLTSEATIINVNYQDIKLELFDMPKYQKSKNKLLPFACQIKLKEWHKAIELLREYDPIKKSYPHPDKFFSYIGVRPQLTNSSIKIGTKALFNCPHTPYQKNKKSYESYPYHLKGKVLGSTPIVWDKQGNHPNGRNILFADGTIEFKKERVFLSLLKHAQKRYPMIKLELDKHEK